VFEQQVDIATAHGETTTFICHPDRGGPFPVIVFFMDAPAIREELRDMARRLACSGYYVMLPNLYYRAGVMELGPLPKGDDPEWRKRMMDLMYALKIPMVMADGDAMLAYADTQEAASGGQAGCLGYCMSGQFAINFAAHRPERINAAASLYGTYLVTDEADSPHIVAHKADAELYFACAEKDHWAPLEMVEALSLSLVDADIEAEVEIYPGVEHGFAFPGRAAYDKAAAEKHWSRLLALFERKLK
jgi:carboxymethylenebutenolidase